MQAIKSSSELTNAIEIIECLLNEKDGDFLIEIIKKYKEGKDIDSSTLNKLFLYLNK